MFIKDLKFYTPRRVYQKATSEAQQHPTEGPIWPSQLLPRVPKLSIGTVREASYEPICLRQVNPITGIKFCLVKNQGTQFNVPLQRKEQCVQVNEIRLSASNPLDCQGG